MMYERNCPKCGKLLLTKNKYWNEKANDEKKPCGSCALKDRVFSDEHKQKLKENHADITGKKNPFYGKRHSDATKKSIGQTQSKRYIDNPDILNRISKAQIEYHKHNKNGFYGKLHSDESKRKMRISKLDYLKKTKNAIPSYNTESISIIEHYANLHGYTFQHAENGGEYHIKELGYYVDGYDVDKNTVIEYYESTHFRGGKLKDRDVYRRNKIMKHLGCRFIEIDYKNNIKIYDCQKDN